MANVNIFWLGRISVGAPMTHLFYAMPAPTHPNIHTYIMYVYIYIYVRVCAFVFTCMYVVLSTRRDEG